MLVDDMVANLQLLGSALYKEGYEITLAENALAALESLDQNLPDLILLDINMPEMDGYELCGILKEKPGTKDIPVIFVTAKTEKEDLIKGFEVGGVDFITKPYDINELLVRLQTHIDLKLSREIIQRNAIELAEANQKLIELNSTKDKYLGIINDELQSAANYVRSILPEQIDTPGLKTEWQYRPSSNLGGDSFGYHWIDEDHFAIYLLDVCGHGVKSALHSALVIGNLRVQTYQDTDFKSPVMVLNALNDEFQMNNHDDLFFTIWYGVYNRKTRILDYASAGHPPALLIGPSGKLKLSSANQGVGMLKKFPCNGNSVRLEGVNDLYLFSDGAYEIADSKDSKWSIDSLYEYFSKVSQNLDSIGQLYDHLIGISGTESLDDDFSILKVRFEG